MAEVTTKTAQPQTQQERWMKYGANVALSALIVLVLAIILIAIAEKKSKRIDTTVNSVYSLKPQTLNIIKDLKSAVKIVSLYTHPQSESALDVERRERADTVADLLAEYKNEGKNIDVEVIDPSVSQSKVDDLYNEVTTKYGGEVKKYKTFLDAFPAKLDDLKKKVDEVATAAAAIPTSNLGNDENSQITESVVETVNQMPKDLDTTKESVAKRVSQKHPDFKKATETAQAALTLTSQRAEGLASLTDDKKYPPIVAKFAVTNAAKLTAIKKEADDLSKEIDALGSLKVDDLAQSLKDPNPIVVMGENDMRVLPYEQVWRTPTQTSMINTVDGKLRPVFAGEQEVSTAILGLTTPKKPKVCIMRNGGAPVATPGFPPFQQGGPMSEVAARLRQYNFDVVEKDLSGTYAMQAQMQGGQPQPEPSDDEVKDAIWIVLATPSPQAGPMGGGSPPIAPKVLDHINNGGSALVLLAPEGEDMQPGLKAWGLDTHTNVVAVHALVKNDQTNPDFLVEAQKYPFVFDITKYGDSVLTKPLETLKSFLVPLMPMRVVDTKGLKISPLIPIPQDPQSWGCADLQSLQTDMDVKYHPEKNDLENTPANPLYGGAAVENEKGTRLVVIGSPSFMFDRFLDAPDPELQKRRIYVSRFPANAELFCNSVYWLAHMEPMIAISPASMQVSRIAAMSDGAKGFWRNGVLLLGLPGLVIVCGIAVYFARRD